MSFSIDDLVSSLSSTHVGQEAMDLAVLQAQLAETLFNTCPSPSSSSSSFMTMPSRGRSQHTQPCNTPLARTPSASWGAMMMDSSSGDRARSNSVSSAYANDMDEDERMVEELLMPSNSFYGSSASNSSSSSSSNSYHNYNQAPLPSPISPHSSMGFASSSSSYNNTYPSSYTDPSPSSLFTTTDPFYLSQLQSLNAPASLSPSSASQSVFAQNGRLSQNSPFANAMSGHGHSHGHGQYQHQYEYQHQHSHQQIPLSSYTAAF